MVVPIAANGDSAPADENVREKRCPRFARRGPPPSVRSRRSPPLGSGVIVHERSASTGLILRARSRRTRSAISPRRCLRKPVRSGVVVDIDARRVGPPPLRHALPVSSNRAHAASSRVAGTARAGMDQVWCYFPNIREQDVISQAATTTYGVQYAQSTRSDSSERAITMRWISEVPSPISHTLASRIIRSTGYSLV